MSIHDEPSKSERDLLSIKAGIEQVLTAGKTMPFQGQSYDQTGLLAVVNALLAPIQLVRSDRATLERDIGARKANAANLEQFVKLFKAQCVVTYGENSNEFVAFGFKPRKKAAPLTPEKKQHKTAQARATRKARGTVGPRVKQSIIGSVDPAEGNAGTPAPPSGGNATGQAGGSNPVKP
ncbi:MAG TPA: hypothetical protein VFF73_00615 [Planctomycetota bacterium]|nr:hypothetical protein [Planctomycetota bacterium]